MFSRSTARGRLLRCILLSSCASVASISGARRAAAQSAAAPAPAKATGSTETVLVTARRQRHNKDFKSTQTVKVLDQDQIRATSIVGGVAKALAIVPGVSTTTYGATGSSKSSISINGIKAGWAGFSGGNPDNGSLGITFDGVPMVNPGNGLWQATLIPQSSLLQTIDVTYGPGQPMDRWYTNIGGGIEFQPIQPSAKAGGEIVGTYGSFNTGNLSFNLQTGDLGGWRTVVAGGVNHADSFLHAPDGFSNNSDNYAFYGKTVRTFNSGDLSFGAYVARSGAYRPLATPLSPISGVNINGYNQPGQVFSEQTTGLYTTLPRNVDYKYDTNAIQLFYTKLNLHLTDAITLHNLIYGDHEQRLHWTPLHDYVPGSESLYEVNQPSSYVVGDKAAFEFRVPYNDAFLGGFVQTSRYHSREQLYNPDLGFVNSPVPVPDGLRGSAAAPNANYDSDIFYTLDSAVFLQDTIRPIPSLDITPGVRFINYATSFHHDEGSEFPLAVLYNPGGELSQFPNSNKTVSRFEPSVGGNWQVLKPLALYASWSRAYRQPENGGGTGPYVALPASAVQLEQGTEYQAGIKLRFGRLGPVRDIFADVSYYHLDFSNETIPTALASGGSLLAFGSSVYSGVNFFAEAQPLQNIYTFLNLGTVSANFKNFTNGSGTFHHVPVANTPDENFNIGLYYRYDAGIATILPRVSYQYTGAQHLYDNSNNITSDQKYPSYGVVNLSTEVDFAPPKGLGTKTVSLTLEVDNLTDERYNSFEYISAGGLYGAGGSTNPQTVGAGAVLGLPAPGRAIYGSVGVKF